MVVLTGGTDDDTGVPWWMNFGVYLLAQLCMVSIPYRLYLFSQCVLNDWTILKHFSPQPVEQWQDPIPMKSRRRAKDAEGRAFRAMPNHRRGGERQTVRCLRLYIYIYIIHIVIDR